MLTKKEMEQLLRANIEIIEDSFIEFPYDPDMAAKDVFAELMVQELLGPDDLPIFMELINNVA